ncbi:MAG: acylphosphatase [Woeseia sp.]
MGDPDSPACRRYRITGRVQGVWFRGSTRDMATSLALTGYARNLADGSVEVLACGRPGALDKLETWLQRGPQMATVTGVEAEALPYRQIDGFSTA